MSFPTDRPVIGTLCYALRDNAVLLMQRNRPPHQGLWSPPGGKIELHESPEECVIREMREETGLTIAEPELRAIVTVIDRAWPIHWLLFVYRTSQFNGSLRESDEGQLRWSAYSELDTLPRPYIDRQQWPHIISDEAGIWRGKFIYNTPQQLVDEVRYL